MKLVDLHPQFVDHGGPGTKRADGTEYPLRKGIGVMFDCPCGCENMCYVPFKNPIDGGPMDEEPHKSAWLRSGTTFETLSLSPSIHRTPALGGCGWHGFVTNGEVTSC